MNGIFDVVVAVAVLLYAAIFAYKVGIILKDSSRFVAVMVLAGVLPMEKARGMFIKMSIGAIGVALVGFPIQLLLHGVETLREQPLSETVQAVNAIYGTDLKISK